MWCFLHILNHKSCLLSHTLTSCASSYFFLRFFLRFARLASELWIFIAASAISPSEQAAPDASSSLLHCTCAFWKAHHPRIARSDGGTRTTCTPYRRSPQLNSFVGILASSFTALSSPIATSISRAAMPPFRATCSCRSSQRAAMLSIARCLLRSKRSRYAAPGIS